MAITAAGFGKHTLTNEDGQIYAVRAGGFTLNKEATSEPILTYPVGTIGTKQPLTTITTETTWTVAMESGLVNDLTMPYLFDSKVATATNLVLPIQTVVVVPAAPGPYTFTVTGLTEDQEISATILDAVAAPGDEYLTQIDASDVGTIATGQVAVTANTLTFHSTDAGKTVLISRRANNATIQVIGGNTEAEAVGSIEVYGALKWLSSEKIWNFWAPNASFSDNLEFGSEVDAITITLTLGSVDGWGLPFVLWQDPT